MDEDPASSAADVIAIIEANPIGDNESRAAYLVGRKWAMKTAKRYGIDGIPRRMRQAMESHHLDVLREAYFALATIETHRALKKGEVPPLMWTGRRN
jgi:hypothetical protein